MDTRRKIQFYLNPETNQADRCVDTVLNNTPQGDRGRLQRAAMLSGFALHKIDPRIPFLLSELLTENTTFSETLQVIKAVLPAAQAERLEEIIQTAPPENIPEQHPLQAGAEDETRSNARGMFGTK
ncbi:plasmid partitioning/stability family protein [Erwinia aphidicola]|jgi:hypothetical protein|uniref:plasmid partitioning/stability family protein n=1 Tax=Erwinia aphidicola TaxID=68334 RepID=UPI00300C8651